ncbi:MAG: mandelate racemase/muconate lactonizing enzyme family protein, partial [Rhizobiaceae bacterium]
MTTIERIELRQLNLDLIRPYKVSFNSFTAFQPLIAVVTDSEGRTGFGDAEITPGYSHETPEGGWQLISNLVDRIVGQSVEDAKQIVKTAISTDPSAASVLYVALEMLAGHAQFNPTCDAVVPLLQPINSFDIAAIPDEVEETLAEGFGTLKIKVGFNVEDDLARLNAIQDANAGRARLRIDANRAYTAEQGRQFASSLDPQDIELFEQPCGVDDWTGHEAVAEVSRVPVMIDESIYNFADIDRAGAIPGVGFVKLKLKKMGGVDLLCEGLQRIREHGMKPVLGDGTATDIGCWQEACVARTMIDNAGEMNGFLKFKVNLFEQNLVFEDGAI